MSRHMRRVLVLLLPLLSSCAYGDEWEQAKASDEAYRQCVERHVNDPSQCTELRTGARNAQQQYEDRGKELWGNPGEYPRP